MILVQYIILYSEESYYKNLWNICFLAQNSTRNISRIGWCDWHEVSMEVVWESGSCYKFTWSSFLELPFFVIHPVVHLQESNVSYRDATCVFVTTSCNSSG